MVEHNDTDHERTIYDCQWRNLGPRRPRCAGGRRIRGAPNCRLNVGQFRKLNLSTSKTARFALETHFFRDFTRVFSKITQFVQF